MMKNTKRSPKLINIEGLIGHCAALCLNGKWLNRVGCWEAALATPFLPFKNTLSTLSRTRPGGVQEVSGRCPGGVREVSGRRPGGVREASDQAGDGTGQAGDGNWTVDLAPTPLFHNN